MPLLAATYPGPGCPDRDVLADFDRGKLPGRDFDVVATHILSCERCETVLSDLQVDSMDDPVISRLKKCLAVAEIFDEPAFAAMEAAAAALGTLHLSASQATGPLRREVERHRPIPGSIGQYEVLEKIGQGGMGVVYLARQTPLKRKVALKMILAGHHASAETVLRFLREGEAVARLSHPNVVQVYELGEHEGLPYYSMELVEGGSLQSKLLAGPLEPRKAAELVRTLALAAEYAHRQGIVHRDLKPANVLLDGDQVPRITDFGLAKLLDTEPGEPTVAHLTAPDAILGTASYMAPEQAEGRVSDMGPATDVYALGSILYEALTGRPPFVGKTRVQTLDLVRSAEPLAPSQLRREVPYWLETVCLRCLEKDVRRRYPSAQALADDLARWLREERPRATPSWARRVARRARRNAGTVLLGSSLAALSAASYVYHPDRTIEAVQRQLASGRAVSLIRQTGEPSWFRWQAGKSKSHLAAADGSLTLHSWTLSLLELLPDPQFPRYRFTAQVRHEKSALQGDVGLFVAHAAYPSGASPIHFFTQLSFNRVHGHGDVIPRFVDGGRPPLVVRDNDVRLFPHLYSDESIKPSINARMSGVSGPRFQALGEDNDRWHDLELIVTPEQVTALWNGQPCSLTASAIRKSATASLLDLARRGAAPRLGGIDPSFNSRGSLGLYVWKGSASFRAVKVTPIP